MSGKPLNIIELFGGLRNVRLGDRECIVELDPYSVNFLINHEDTGVISDPFDERYARDVQANAWLGSLATSQTVRQETKGEKVWRVRAWRAPTLLALDAISKSYFRPIGAHTFPFRLSPSKDDGLFTDREMVEAFADCYFPISNEPDGYFHDTVMHSIGVMALHDSLAHRLSKISQFALSRDVLQNPDEAAFLFQSIVEAYDYNTYCFDREVIHQLEPIRRDKVLSELAGIAFRLQRPHEQRLNSLLDKPPYILAPSARRVNRYKSVTAYYKQISELLGEHKSLEPSLTATE